MKFRIPLLILITLPLAASSCFRVRDLVLVNSSDHPVTVRLKHAPPYSPKTDRGCSEGFSRPPLSIAPDSADLDPRSKAWVPLDTTAVHSENGAYDFQIIVPSRTAVFVDEMSDHRACVGVLEIENGSHIDRFMGDDILRAFKKRSVSLWVYEIRA